MAEQTFTGSFVEFMKALDKLNIKRPVSIQLASKEEALRIIGEVGAPCTFAAMRRAESGEMQGFLLFGIEFWWRPEPAALEIQQGLRAA